MKKPVKKIKKKKMTIEELAEQMNKSFAGFEIKIDSKIDSKIEELAVATKKGFDEVYQRITVFEEETRENFARVRHDIKEELSAVSVRVEKLERRK